MNATYTLHVEMHLGHTRVSVIPVTKATVEYATTFKNATSVHSFVVRDLFVPTMMVDSIAHVQMDWWETVIAVSVSVYSI